MMQHRISQPEVVQYQNDQGEKKQQQGKETSHRLESGIFHRMDNKGYRVQQVGHNPHRQ